MINKKTFHPRGRKVASAVPPQFASLSQRTHARPSSGHTITGVPVPFYSPATNWVIGGLSSAIPCGDFTHPTPVDAFSLWRSFSGRR